MTTTILVVDDSEIVLAVARTILEAAGYRVLTQARASGSVSLIVSERPALVLLDVNMPTLSGDTIARMCARTAQATGTVVALHSSMDEVELKRLVEESGADAYIRKTDSPYAFLNQVRRLLGDSHLGPGRSISSGTMKVASPSPDSQRQMKGVLLVDRDMTVLATMREIVRALGHRSEFALSVAQAVEKIRAATRPSVVVVSSDMPDDGLKRLLECVKSVDAELMKRLVVITTPASSGAVPFGFPGIVISKPLDPAAFTRAIARALVEYPPAASEGRLGR